MENLQEPLALTHLSDRNSSSAIFFITIKLHIVSIVMWSDRYARAVEVVEVVGDTTTTTRRTRRRSRCCHHRRAHVSCSSPLAIHTLAQPCINCALASRPIGSDTIDTNGNSSPDTTAITTTSSSSSSSQLTSSSVTSSAFVTCRIIMSVIVASSPPLEDTPAAATVTDVTITAPINVQPMLSCDWIVPGSSSSSSSCITLESVLTDASFVRSRSNSVITASMVTHIT